MKTEPAIYCPRCRWRPAHEDRWMCAPDGCGTVWNTFWTHGLCPGCSHRWEETECLACRAISPHKAWYHWPDDARSEREGRSRRKMRELP